MSPNLTLKAWGKNCKKNENELKKSTDTNLSHLTGIIKRYKNVKSALS